MADRRLVGILALAFILSSGALSFFVGERVRNPIEILKSEWNIPNNSLGNYELPRVEGRYVYSLGLVVRKPLRRLELHFATVENSSFQPMEGAKEGASPIERFLTIAELGTVTSRIKKFTDEAQVYLEQEFRLDTPAGEYDGLLVDLTNPVRPVAPDRLQHSLPSVHVVLFDEKGQISQYYKGFPDFYLNRDHAIMDITIQHNRNVTKFSQRTTQQGTSLLMDDAPPIERLSFDDLEKEDQVFVTVAIDSARPELSAVINPPYRAVIHLVSIFVDGVYQDGLATPIYR